MVLGAGASRGAEFIEEPPDDGTPPLCLPPLNADFFTQLQRITTGRHQATVDAVLKDVLELHGTNFSLTLEEYFTQIEAMLLTARLSQKAAEGFSTRDLMKRRTNLLEALSAVLEESADVAKSRSLARRHPCSYHAALVDALAQRDTIISFNYDCIVDHALRTASDGKWSAKHGYGFPKPGRVAGHEAWNSPDWVDRQNSSINLLKLHGSINWYPFPNTDDGIIRLRERPYKQRGQKLYEIIPPEFVKSIANRPIFPQLWSKAELALRRASVLCFVGFSFTPTDLHVEALFRLALAANKNLKRLVVANPSPDHRRRIRSVCSGALRNGAHVVQFETLREFAPHMRDLLTGGA